MGGHKKSPELADHLPGVPASRPLGRPEPESEIGHANSGTSPQQKKALPEHPPEIRDLLRNEPSTCRPEACPPRRPATTVSRAWLSNRPLLRRRDHQLASDISCLTTDSSRARNRPSRFDLKALFVDFNSSAVSASISSNLLSCPQSPR